MSNKQGTDAKVEPASKPNTPPPALANTEELVTQPEVEKNQPAPTQDAADDEKLEVSTEPSAPKHIVRRYKENTTFFSDLFKLQVAKLLQWKGWTKISQNAPRDQKGNLNDDWVLTEHCHYFHTYDSNGKEQFYSQPVAQHVHKMLVTRDPNDHTQMLEVKCVSGPMKWKITDEFGKRQKVLVPDPHDDHTHDTLYIKSNELSKPNMNSDAAMVVSRAEVAGTSKVVFDEQGKQLGKLEVR